MSDSINEAAATPSVSLAAVVTRTTLSTTLSMRQQLRPPFRWPQLSHARCCSCHRHVAARVCVFKNYVCRQALVYHFFLANTVCRPNTKTKINRRHTHYFFGMYQLETRFARIITSRHGMCHSSALNISDATVPMAETAGEPILPHDVLHTSVLVLLRLSAKLAERRKYGLSAGKGMPMLVQISRRHVKLSSSQLVCAQVDHGPLPQCRWSPEPNVE